MPSVVQWRLYSTAYCRWLEHNCVRLVKRLHLFNQFVQINFCALVLAPKSDGEFMCEQMTLNSDPGLKCIGLKVSAGTTFDLVVSLAVHLSASFCCSHSGFTWYGLGLEDVTLQKVTPWQSFLFLFLLRPFTLSLHDGSILTDANAGLYLQSRAIFAVVMMVAMLVLLSAPLSKRSTTYLPFFLWMTWTIKVLSDVTCLKKLDAVVVQMSSMGATCAKAHFSANSGWMANFLGSFLINMLGTFSVFPKSMKNTSAPFSKVSTIRAL